MRVTGPGPARSRCKSAASTMRSGRPRQISRARKSRPTINFTLLQVKSYYEMARSAVLSLFERPHAGFQAASIPPLKRMAPRGAILASASVIVMAMPDHHPVVMVPTVIPMPAVIAMHFGTCAVMVAVAVPDHDGFSTGNRRRRNSDRAKRGDNVSKLLHVFLLHCARIKHRKRRERSPGTAREF
jgi:hypothetical protein